MKIRIFLLKFIIVFILAFGVNLLTVYLWNLIKYGEGNIDLGLAFVFSIVLGLIVPATISKFDKN